MRIIIPAAGLGSRLLPMTKFRPKGLVEVGGKSLLAHSLERMYEAGITEAICVTGYYGDLMERELVKLERRPELYFIRNSDYATTNSIVSLILTRKWWDQEFCIVESDVLFKPQLLQKLLVCSGDCMVVDNSQPPHQIDVKIELKNDYIWDIDKDLPIERTDGEFVGLSRWTPKGARDLGIAIDRLLEEGHDDVWYEYAARDIAKRVPISPIYTDSSEWIEIDTLADLQAAERFYRSNSTLFFSNSAGNYIDGWVAH